MGSTENIYEVYLSSDSTTTSKIDEFNKRIEGKL